jgi:hypothetical protein
MLTRSAIFYEEIMCNAAIQQLLTLLILISWCLMVTGCGRLMLSCAQVRCASRQEALFVSAALGIILTGYAVFVLGCLKYLSPQGISRLLIALTLLACAGWLRSLPVRIQPDRTCSRWDLPFALLLALLLLSCFLLALIPETGKDALIYHLAVPKHYLSQGGFSFLEGNVFAGYPLLGEMHYILALFLHNDILAKLIHFSILCALLLGIFLCSCHVLSDQRFPALSMLLFLSIPSVYAVSHTAYNDLFVSLFTLAALYTFLRWLREEVPAWLIFCGIFSGAAAACKYTALLMVPLGCLGILLTAQQRRLGFQSLLRWILPYLLSAWIAGSPFYVKNLLLTGNPFYPFFHSLFGGVGWDQDQARLYDLFIQGLGMGRDFWDYLLLPFNLSFRAQLDSPLFDGILGPVFLLTLPFLACTRPWEVPIRVMLTYLFFTFLFWAFSAQQIRYLIPLIPLLALISANVLSRCRLRKNCFGLLLLIITGCLAFNLFHIVADFRNMDPCRAVVGLESRESFLNRTIPTYVMYRYANDSLPPDARIFLLYMKNYTFLCERDCYADAMFEAHTLQKFLQGEPTPETVRDRIKARGFTHLLLDAYYLLGEPSPLSAEEKERFRSLMARHLLPLKTEGRYVLFALHPP